MSETITAGAKIETNHDENSGLVGCFARARGDGRTDGLAAGDQVLLTAGHVLFPGFARLPDTGVFTPKYSSCCSNGDRIATAAVDSTRIDDKQPNRYTGGSLTTGLGLRSIKVNPYPVSAINAGIAGLDGGVTFHNVWPGNVAIKGAVTDGLGIGAAPGFGTGLPALAQYARVYTPSAGLVHGTMLAFPSTDTPEDPEHLLYPRDIKNTSVAMVGRSDERDGVFPLIDQFLFLPRPTPIAGDTLDTAYGRSVPSFSDSDAGAVVINDDNLAIGLMTRFVSTRSSHFADLGAEITGAIEWKSASNIGLVCVMRWVLSHHNIEIPAADGGWTDTTKASGARVQVPDGFAVSPERAAERRGLDRLRSGLRASRRGRVLMAKVERYRREVRQMFDRVRALQVAWREMQGASFYHHAVSSLRDPTHAIPERINGVSRAQAVDVLLPLIRRHASLALARDIDRYREWAFGELLPITTIHEVPAIAARPWPRS